MEWIKIWVKKWMVGSTRYELEPAERSIWVDILVRAGINDPVGQIDFFSYEQLSNQFNVPLELFSSTLDKFIALKKISINRNKIKVLNWGKYQTWYDRKHESKIPPKKEKLNQKFGLRKEEEKKKKRKEKDTPPKILLDKDCRFENITEEDFIRWKETYPALDIGSEIKRIEEHARANPTWRKSNWRRTINGWLRRSQDSARPEKKSDQDYRDYHKEAIIEPENKLTLKERVEAKERLKDMSNAIGKTNKD